MKLIVDLIYEGGLGPDALFDFEHRGVRRSDARRTKLWATKPAQAMKEILADIQDGNFAQGMDRGKQELAARIRGALREKEKQHPIEAVGAQLRGMMSWLPQRRKKKRRPKEPAKQVVNA